MRRVLLLAVLLPGCSVFGPPKDACTRLVEADPDVQALEAKSVVNVRDYADNRDALARARDKAALRCGGAQPLGGVERRGPQ